MSSDDFNFRPIQDDQLFTHGGRVKGKVVLITGAASGIGQEAALRFAEHGAKVVIGDRNLAGAEQTVKRIVDAGGSAKCTSCDVTSWDTVVSLFEFTLKEYGAVDIVVANAGVDEIGAFLTVSLDPSGRPQKPNMATIDINVVGTLYTTHLAQHYLTMGKAPGDLKSIVLLGSMSSWFGIPGGPLYSASKHAILGLMRSMHPLLAPQGVRIAVVHPWFVDTGILPIPVKLFLAGIPLAPLARVAGTIFYSATDPDPTTDGSAWLLLDDSPVVVLPKESFKFGVYKAVDMRINALQSGIQGVGYYFRLADDIMRILKLKNLLIFSSIVGLVAIVLVMTQN